MIDEMLNNPERIKMLLGLMGESAPEEESFQRTLDTVKNLRTVMGILDTTQNINALEEGQEITNEETTLYAANRQEEMVSAAIPFLDEEYQKSIYIALRLLQIRRAMAEDGTLLQMRSRQDMDLKERRKKLLKTLRPYIMPGDKERLDTVLKVLDLQSIMRST